MINKIGRENNDLVVEFKNGSRYKYFDVDEDTYKEFESAGSIGTYFSHNIKHAYAYEKLD